MPMPSVSELNLFISVIDDHNKIAEGFILRYFCIAFLSVRLIHCDFLKFTPLF